MYEDVAPGQVLTPEDRRVLEEALARGFDGAYLYRGGTWLGLRLRPSVPPESELGDDDALREAGS